MEPTHRSLHRKPGEVGPLYTGAATGNIGGALARYVEDDRRTMFREPSHHLECRYPEFQVLFSRQSSLQEW